MNIKKLFYLSVVSFLFYSCASLVDDNMEEKLKELDDLIEQIETSEEINEESSNSSSIPDGVSSACYCMDALSGGKIYNSSASYSKCKKMFICWDNAQADCMLGTSQVWYECIGN